MSKGSVVGRINGKHCSVGLSSATITRFGECRLKLHLTHQGLLDLVVSKLPPDREVGEADMVRRLNELEEEWGLKNIPAPKVFAND